MPQKLNANNKAPRFARRLKNKNMDSEREQRKSKQKQQQMRRGKERRHRLEERLANPTGNNTFLTTVANAGESGEEKNE